MCSFVFKSQWVFHSLSVLCHVLHVNMPLFYVSISFHWRKEVSVSFVFRGDLREFVRCKGFGISQICMQIADKGFSLKPQQLSPCDKHALKHISRRLPSVGTTLGWRWFAGVKGRRLVLVFRLLNVPGTCKVHFRNGSAETVVRAVTPRKSCRLV